MKIGLFTSNQPRHLALAATLAEVADSVHVVQECATVFPGQVADFYKKTPVMQEYFRHVQDAERTVFGNIGYLPSNVYQLALRVGDLNMVDLDILEPVLSADAIVVFGASWIRSPLIEKLVERNAINIHMGLSPWYRGSSCNFWALYDGHPEMVGATIHRLSRGLDSGPMLFHALPRTATVDAFLLGMLAVKAAHQGLAARIADGSLLDLPPQAQDKSLEIRYTRNADFNDDVAQDYLNNRRPSPQQVFDALQARDLTAFLDPFMA